MRHVATVPVVLPLTDVYTGDLGRLWVVADNHWRHNSIMRLCNRPADHEARMNRGWMERVADDDTVLHLGDAWFGDNNVDMLTALPGHVILLRGNHDRSNADWYVRKLGWTVVKSPLHAGVLTTDIDGARVALSHAPLSRRYLDWDVNVHGHIHNNGYHPDVCTMRRERDTRHLCVSVECTDYAPQRLLDVVRGQAMVGSFDTLGMATIWKERDLL